MKKTFGNMKKKSLVIGLISITILLVITGFLFNSFALIEPIPSISFTSENLNYETSEPGAWKVEKSAEWISREKARITFQVDTIPKVERKQTDIILVLDISGSMAGDKLERVKEDSKELIDTVLDDSNNKVALITFDTTSKIVSEFTNQKQELMNKIDSLSVGGITNYYQALVNVDIILKEYTKENDKECMVLFLTDGSPNSNTPNERGQYSYLKEQYPNLTIQGIQYEMGEYILESIKRVSDNQFSANMTNLSNILFQATVVPTYYDTFVLTDYIDTDYFYVENKNDISISEGEIVFDKEEQKITWTINNLKTGSKPWMKIDAVQKEETKNSGLVPTNKRENVESQLDNVKENVESTLTPILKDSYRVIYEGNAPSNCTVSGVPGISTRHVLESVEISNSVPTCEGYQFKGWKIVTDNTEYINQDYLLMPESDVVLRAEWSSLSVSKLMDGEVYEYTPSVMRKVAMNDNQDIWQFKSSITKIVFQNSIQKIDFAREYDISEAKNSSVMAYVVSNRGNLTTQTVYIQADGEIVANLDSSNLFLGFTKLETIEGIEYLNTSFVENMDSMFGDCFLLKNLDLNHFDTSKVTSMRGVFNGCRLLTSLDVSSFDTSNVTTFRGLFADCQSLSELNLSNLNTSKVTNMDSMFDTCDKLASLDLSSFDTSNVTDMSGMFSSCSSLTSLDVSHFDTSKVTDMSAMFSSCSSLTSLDVSHFDTSKVTDISSMFRSCRGLTSLELSDFNTSNVTSMQFLFYGCSSLTKLDISSFNTGNVTVMKWMFSGCENILSLDLTNFNTSNVTDMSYMFGLSKTEETGIFMNLENLNISSFDTSKVNNMSGMFAGCWMLASLDISNFDTSNVTNMGEMFSNCSSLTSLDLSNFDTSNVKITNQMFYGCPCLVTEILISNPNVSSYSDMFNWAAGNGGYIIVDYTEETSDLVDKMIATKSIESNVVKGYLVIKPV